MTPGIRSLFALAFVLLGAPSFAQQQTPWSGSAAVLPGVIQAEAYDLGGEGTAWHDTESGNAFACCGPVFRSDDMDVGNIPNNGGYHIGAVEPTEWAEYTVRIATSGSYRINVRYASAYPSATFRLWLDDTAISNSLTVQSTTDWQQYSTVSFPLTQNLTAGTNNRVLKVSFDAGHLNLDSIEFVSQTPWNLSPAPIPGVIQAEEYDRGGEGVAWHDLTAGNAFGSTVFRSDDMDVGAIPAANGGGYHLGAIDATEWAEYTVNVNTPGSYSVSIRYASLSSATFRLLLDDVDISGAQTVQPTSGWQQYSIVSFPLNRTLSASTNSVLRINFESGALNLDSLELVAGVCNPPGITTHPVAPDTPNYGTNWTSIDLRGDATGTGLTYRWYRDGQPLQESNFYVGTATNHLILRYPDPNPAPGSSGLLPLEQGLHGGSYRLRVTASCGLYSETNAATVRIYCGAPAINLRNVARALTPENDGGDVCWWGEDLSMNFPNHSLAPCSPYNNGGAGSYNRPVISAAAAYVLGSDPTGMRNWWITYLNNELGNGGTTLCNQVPVPSWYYGGQELGSSVYQQFNIACVLAVRHRAQQLNDTGLSNLAGQWLRATFALHALSAVNVRPVQQFAAEPYPAAARTEPFCRAINYDGPFIAMAGMRSEWGHWFEAERSNYFAAAIGWPTNGAGSDPPTHRTIRTVLQQGNQPDPYGLTQNDRTALTALMTNHTRPTNFLGYFVPTTLRTQVPYHILAWSGGKASLMETSTHNATAPTYGVAYLRPQGHAYFLYPWQGVFACDNNELHQTGIVNGTATLNLTGQNHYMEASHEQTATHPATTVRTDVLPSAASLDYWLVLSPTAAPAWQSCSGCSSAQTNLASGKPATQSSTNSGTPQLAVDGNTDGNYFNGSVTHTLLDAQAWWQVDLGSVSSISDVRVWNRTDCCSDRLSNFYVLVSDAPFSSTNLSTTIAQPGVSSYSVAGQAGSPTYVTVNRSGRYVRVQLSGSNYLSLAEVKVFGVAGTPPAETVWVEDSVPGGASTWGDWGDAWTWIGSSPAPYSGSLAHQSNLTSGPHQHYFYNAPSTLSINPGDSLFAYVYLDPSNPPSEVMLQFNDGTWEHRAYWGPDQLNYWGTAGTASRRSMGSLPAAGQWVRLEVPASSVGLEGRTLNGMAFTLYGGRATWDRAGKVPGSETVWSEDSVPGGAATWGDWGDAWTWIGSSPAPYSGSLAHQSNLTSGPHQHYFYNATSTLSINPGESLFAYVYLDPSNPPTEVMLQFNDGTWEHRAYWGPDQINYWGTAGTASRRSMGPLPPAGQWVRLEVPASSVGLEGRTLNGMAFTLYGGRATWDRAGKKP